MEETVSAITLDEIEVKCKSSGRTFKLRELNGFDQMAADRAADSNKTISIGTYRVVMSIIAINGVPEPRAKSALALEGRMRLMKGRELDEVIGAYVKAFDTVEEDLGNESTDSDSQPSTSPSVAEATPKP